MIHQLLIINENGLCLVDRTYNDKALDPFLVSGFLAATIPNMEALGLTMENIVSAINEDKNSYLSVLAHGPFVYAGIIDRSISNDEFLDVLNQIMEKVEPQLFELDPSSLRVEDLEHIQQEIDVIISQEGIPAKTSSANTELLPILQMVTDGKMSPEKAAKHIINAIEKRKYDKTGISNLKDSLVLLDSLFPKTRGSKLHPLQEIIKATYQGVSRLVVRMDNALMF